MPSKTKTLHFLGSALLTALSVGVLGYAMSTRWGEVTMDCTRRGTDFGNGTAVVTFLLFNGTIQRSSCPTFGGTDKFEVIPKLVEKGVGAAVVLHGLVLCLLVLCLLFSAISILISLYNSVSNPYQTYMGPIGIYTCSSLSTCLSVVVLIIFAVNIHVTTMAEDVVDIFAGSIPVDLKIKAVEMQLGFFLVILYIVLSVTAIIVIYLYAHAAYTHKKQQEKPTEDAPKEIMMY